MPARRRVELLAPAGGPPALQAALSAGADAVYLGLDDWSARAFAANFDAAALLAAIDRAHLFGARVHLALNVLLKDDELEPALAALAAPYEAGLDALIVADLGFAALVRAAYPALALHASTQLDTHASAQLERLAALGFSRVILARELSLAEIAALQPHGLALEAFVHGALCYGYSGACLLSSMASGRSGNRGRCSQACRMRYTLAPAAAGHGRRAAAPAHRVGEAGPQRGDEAAGEARRVLSTADLAAIGALPGLLAAGVTSLKIEGRMKDAGYVAVTTAVYREALDAALADPEGYEVRPDWLARLEQSFSRSFTTAHLEGRHAAVRSGGRGGRRGLQIGRVEAVDEARGLATVRVEAELHEGDVLQVYTSWGATQPAPLSALLAGELGGARVVLRLSERVGLKDRVFRTSSGRGAAVAADAVAGRVLARPVALGASLRARRGEPARLTVTAAGCEATVEGEAPLEAARTAGLTADKARRAVGALGGTPYVLATLDYDADDGVFLGVGALKELRRRAVAELDGRRLAGGRRAQPAARPPGAAPRPAAAHPLSPRSAGERGPLVVVRLRPGERPAAAAHTDAVCVDLRAGDDLDLVAATRAAATAAGLAVRVRSPEVLFDGDASWASAVAGMGWDVVYARHVGALGWAPVAYLEYPLQGLNPHAAGVLGAAGLVASPELTLEELARFTAPGAGRRPVVEALVFGREQVLVSRDALGLAEGFAPPARLMLTDARGYAFPVQVAGDETRIFNARVTNLCGRLSDLVAAGVDGVHVVQGDLRAAERAAFARSGLTGLAGFDDRERFTTGHLYRGVA